MGGKEKKQNQFKHMILTPFRIISKAKDFYMKGMVDLEGRVRQGGGLGGPTAVNIPTVPRSFSSVRSSKGNEEDDEDYKELLRSVSKRNEERQRARDMGPNYGSDMEFGGNKMRSYSVGIGKIGRIEEDEPCEFEEGDRADLYPRSRSHAVGRRNVVGF